MCGRFAIDATSHEIMEAFDLISEPPVPTRQFNLAPTDDVLVVRETDAGREGSLYRWGLLPFWAKDRKQGARAINARAETLWTKNTFRESAQKRRCLVIGTGFFEWETVADGKQPWLFSQSDGRPFAMAGLWSKWRPKDDKTQVVRTCTIVTTEPNGPLSAFHDRMPVVLDDDLIDVWLDPDTPQPVLAELLRPAPDQRLTATAVSRLVNSVKNHGPECVAPLA